MPAPSSDRSAVVFPTVLVGPVIVCHVRSSLGIGPRHRRSTLAVPLAYCVDLVYQMFRNIARGLLELRVEELREQHHLTQRDLAYMLGVTEKTIQFWEHGKRHPTRRHREAIKRRFGVE